MKPLFSILKIETLRLGVHLGWSDEERSRLQPVDLDIWVRFAELPSACMTDELSETSCYAEISQAVFKLVESRSFRLIEALASQLFSNILEQIPKNAGLWIQVKKVDPPIVGLRGGASFCIGTEDFSRTGC